jgi:hypothetical protein
LPASQLAYVSHVEVALLGVQAWSSGMTVGHVPPLAPFVKGQLPTRHRT